MPFHPKLACCRFFDSHADLLWPSCPCFWPMRGKEGLFVGDPQTYLRSPTFILNPTAMLPVAHELYHCLDAENRGCSKLTPLPSTPALPPICPTLPSESHHLPLRQDASFHLSFARTASASCPLSLPEASCPLPALTPSASPHPLNHGMTAVS